MKRIIKFDVPNKLVYQTIKEEDGWKSESDFFPLPWGEMEMKNVTISGAPWSSAGGAWYWELPDFCIMGYGKYNPWVKFRFSGTIIVTQQRDHFIDRPPGFGFRWGWRQGDSKWVYLLGKLSPCDEYIAEKLFLKIYNEKKREKENDYCNEYSQGHLYGKHYHAINKSVIEDERFKKITDTYFSRRKIFNHQFFGENIQILYIQSETWAVIAPNGGRIVSPDHLNEPIHLEEGITIFSHPFPDGDDID